jgi:protein-S-isoprenylcysteine O-methyltransferase Ste14
MRHAVHSMNDESAFRAFMIVALVVLLPFGVYHRVRSQSTGESLDRRQEGLFILSTLRPAAIVLWGCVIAYLIDPRWMAWSSVPLPAAVRWLGAAICIAAEGLFAWTLRSLGPNLTDTVVTRRAATLVTSGPYRWVRHPFYDAMVLLILAISLLTANWFLLLGGIVVTALVVTRTRIEEEKLVEKFGDGYRRYMAETGRFLPKLAGPVAPS